MAYSFLLHIRTLQKHYITARQLNPHAHQRTNRTNKMVTNIAACCIKETKDENSVPPVVRRGRGGVPFQRVSWSTHTSYMRYKCDFSTTSGGIALKCYFSTCLLVVCHARKRRTGQNESPRVYTLIHRYPSSTRILVHNVAPTPAGYE